MKNVLISGDSFAGLCTAYWMNKMGYQVTLVELSPELKKGGTPVNIMENTIDIVTRMGLFDQIVANNIYMKRTEFKNAAGETVHSDGNHRENEYEIERDVILKMLYNVVEKNTEFLFGDTIAELAQFDVGVHVKFKHHTPKNYDLVFGCDGVHSAVRRLTFGEESQFSHFLGTYFSITIVDKLLIPEFSTQIYNEPCRMIMLNAYNGKTDIVLCYNEEQEVSYDYRNEAQQRQMIYDHFEGAGWRSAELVHEVKQSGTFYFDKLCQIKMPSWSKGRVALVGDAAYCPPPAAGRGGSLAIDGAAALAEAFEKYPADHEKAFQYYDTTFRPFIEEVQTMVVDYSLDMLMPKTEAAIAERNKRGFNM